MADDPYFRTETRQATSEDSVTFGGEEWSTAESGGVEFESGIARPSAIPDSVDERWPADDDGTQNIDNSIGTVEIALDFDRWTSGTQYNGGVAVDARENDDMRSNGRVALTQSQYSYALWVENVTVLSTTALYVACGDSGIYSGGYGGLNNGWAIGASSLDATTVTIGHMNGGTVNTADHSLSTSPADEQLMIGLSGDGDSYNLYTFDSTATLQDEFSGSLSRGTQTDGELQYLNTGGDYLEAVYDDMTATTSEAYSESKFRKIAETTGPNA